ncbi:Sirohydrochlorin ferrochelatase [Quadrisphaera granulorum]|uniref:Sirohydrochlorin ferrochelatase n=1 Tax=Quadrisphaera granulorum TaxID=317664 RepID=A0A316A678_9ACTN|nr:CbiX/SirB N-terminal domain-containing protein [Quadrisphaera granulorum]PWJ53185.1 sirohydrochlorin ferrochelatase [Quadrisphaera granulorum]SZE97117.1 Sirohydrochlorin ferrochelatase [Quadrisphaera granulorum]
MDQLMDQSVPPVLVAVSHGTRSATGRRTIAQLRLAVAAARPGLEVVAAHVDVQKPALEDVVLKLAAAGRACVVVPLLLSTGYHVRSDVNGAVRAARKAGGSAVAAAALGPDPALVDVLCHRLTAAGAHDDDAVVLAAAGSLAPQAVADVEHALAALTARRTALGGGPVVAGYASAQEPTVPQACAALRAAHPGRRVAVVPYLLAPGVFSQRLDALLAPAAGTDAGTADGQALADVVAQTLCADGDIDPRIAALALRRYDEALELAAEQAREESSALVS